MAKTKEEVRFERIEHVSNYKLPATYTREIGRVVVRWAYFEHHVQSMIWALAFDCDEASGALGRLAVIEQKFPDRFKLLADLAKVRGWKFDPTLLKSLANRSEKLAEERNLLIHGCWTRHAKHRWMIRQTRGAWETGWPSGTKKKVLPEEKRKDAKGIAHTVSELEKLIEDMHAFRGSIVRSVPVASPA